MPVIPGLRGQGQEDKKYRESFKAPRNNALMNVDKLKMESQNIERWACKGAKWE